VKCAFRHLTKAAFREGGQSQCKRVKKHCPLGTADSRSDAQEILCIFSKWKVNSFSPSFFLIHIILSFHLRLDLPSSINPSVFTTRILYAFPLYPMHTCDTYLVLLDVIISTVCGEKYKLFSSSLCNYFHSATLQSLWVRTL
jgi:hypothetical protein